MQRIDSVLIGVVGWLVPTVAFATTGGPVLAVPEPTSALLFAAGVAVAAISIRMIRRK